MASKIENNFLLWTIVSVLALQSLSTPASCSRRIQEGLSEEKNYYGPSTPYNGSPHKHSSSKSPSCPTPSGGSSGHGTPTTPSHGSGSVHHNTPPSYGDGGSPTSPTPETTFPSPPTTTIPSPSVDYDHSGPPYHPGTCSYWSAHPDKIVAVIGYLGTMGDIFGAGCIFAFGGKNPTLHDAIANKDTDGFSALLREGTAALLNSIACKSFPFTKQQVKSSFAAALVNAGAAAAQADVFKSANVGLYKS
ncbi:hypothetical protein KFK09_026472 [Dendrobium nobile]|uniref:Protodermal factor 1 n=1 Tax=Dendrobium nobile TaxID=94219 RepID=A0A8T3ACZ3_DENNO|nr:hypothetical protein KFK09_026472 [Dendrobium nobile]